MFLKSAVIILLGLVAFGAMLPAPFRIMDDRLSIVENPLIKSFQEFPLIFKEGYFHDQSYYRPMVSLSFMIEYQVHGLDAFYYNLDNLMLHIINALLVFLLISMLTKSETIGFGVGLLFVMHPIQWEAVCNIQGRSMLLSAFFVLISFILFLKYLGNYRWSYLVLVLITFFLGLLSKESTVIFPLVLIVFLSIDETFSWKERLKIVSPLVIVILGYLIVRKVVGVTDASQIHESREILLSFITFLRSVITDLRLFIFPYDLHYDRCLPLLKSLSQPQAIMTCLFWITIFVFLILIHRKLNSFILFLISWFCIELIPVSQLGAGILVGAGHISTAEHFLYLASVPMFVGIVMALRWGFESSQKSRLMNPFFLKLLAGGFFVFLLLMAIEQSISASNEFNMITRSLFYEPQNPRLQANLGLLYVFKNDTINAEKHFRLAVKIEPLNPTYHIKLGTALCQEGRWIEGLAQLVVFDPGQELEIVRRQEKLAMDKIQVQLTQGKNFDARGWLTIGIYEAQTQVFKPAIEAFLKSVTLNPGQTDAWFNLGSLYEEEKDWVDAKRAFQKVLELHDLTEFQKDFATAQLTKLADR